jgi:hypothetical protein
MIKEKKNKTLKKEKNKILKKRMTQEMFDNNTS